MFAWNLCHGTLSTPEQNEIIPLLSLVLVLNIWHLLLVFLLLTLNIYLFSVFDLLIFQSFLDYLFKISKLECVNNPFFRTPSINYSGVIFQGKIPFGFKSPGVDYPVGSFMGVIFQGVIVHEGNYSGVIIQRTKVRRVIFLGGFCSRKFPRG